MIMKKGGITPMKKLSGMLALGMALALTFGMTVSAAESPATQNPDFKPTESQTQTAQSTIDALPEVTDVKTTVTQVNSQGQTVRVEVKLNVQPIKAETVAELQSTNVTEKAVDSLKTNGGEAKVTETIAKAMAAANASNKVDSAKQKVTDVKIGKTPVAAAVIEVPAGVKIPDSGLRLEISLPGFKPAAGKTYVVMHLGKDGWEIIAPDAIANGKVTATFKDLSPVTVNEVTFTVVPVEDPQPVGEEADNGEEDSNDDSEQAQAAAPAANPATSPKTAETLPAAGVMALICLAGAAVCAGKIRYNK